MPQARFNHCGFKPEVQKTTQTEQVGVQIDGGLKIE